MEKAKWVKKIEGILDSLFPNPKVPLNHKDAYTLLIATLLSARCTDERVNRITPTLFKKADTPQKMMELSFQEIEQIIKPCGLSPQKSKAIWKLSEKLLKEHKGQVPETLEELEDLPGVGHKTASVVLVQAFQKPAFPVDTHIFRSARRWKLSRGKTVKQVEEDLKRLFLKSKWGKVHLQIVLFARTYCPARAHKEDSCPICRFIKSS